MFVHIITKRRLTTAITVLIFIIALLLTIVFRSVGAAGQTPPQNAATTEQRILFLKNCGITVDESEAETQKSVTIPTVFNEVFSEYNELQKRSGYDLSEHAGQNAVQYTYRLNYAERDDVYAHLLVQKNSVIGGDICAVSAKDGFMLPLIEKQSAASEK